MNETKNVNEEVKDMDAKEEAKVVEEKKTVKFGIFSVDVSPKMEKVAKIAKKGLKVAGLGLGAFAIFKVGSWSGKRSASLNQIEVDDTPFEIESDPNVIDVESVVNEVEEAVTA